VFNSLLDNLRRGGIGSRREAGMASLEELLEIEGVAAGGEFARGRIAG
jgi:hypothetical protein